MLQDLERRGVDHLRYRQEVDVPDDLAAVRADPARVVVELPGRVHDERAVEIFARAERLGARLQFRERERAAVELAPGGARLEVREHALVVERDVAHGRLAAVRADPGGAGEDAPRRVLRELLDDPLAMSRSRHDSVSSFEFRVSSSILTTRNSKRETRNYSSHSTLIATIV